MSTAEKEPSNINLHPSSEVEGERIRTEGNENTNGKNKEKNKKKGKRNISNPRRLLILTPTPHSTKIIPPFLLGLTGEAVNSENIITTITTATATSSPSTALSTTQPIVDAQREEEQQLDTDTGDRARDGRTTATDSRTTISFAGYTTHAPFRIDNKYYKTEVGIWVDEVPLSVPTSPNFNYSETNTITTRITTPLPQRGMEDEQEEKRDGREAVTSATPVLNTDTGPTSTHTPTPIYSSPSWKTEFLGDEAREVRNAIGAVVLCVLNPSLNAPLHDHSNHRVGLQGLASRTTSSSSLTVSHREDVQAIKELIHMIGEVKNKIEEEREDREEEAGGAGGAGGVADVPSLLVLVGESSKHRQSQPESQTAPRATRDLGDEMEETLGFEVFGTDWWEEEIYNMGLYGFEVIAWDPKSDSFPGEEKRNLYGEFEGMSRIREVLETYQWSSPADEDSVKDPLLDDDFFDDDRGLRMEANELEREMMGVRLAIQNSGSDSLLSLDDGSHSDTELEVEELEALMMRMRTIRDMSAGLPEAQRKAFAAKAIQDIIKDL